MGWILGFSIGLLVYGIAFSAQPLAAYWKAREARAAISLFRQQREPLQRRFLEMARSLGKPRGLRWLDCDWFDDVSFARERTSGLLTAFVGINVRFEAVEGGDMEDVAAIDTIRDAAAIFHFSNGAWGTGGKALFNMNAHDAPAKLVAQFEPVKV